MSRASACAPDGPAPAGRPTSPAPRLKDADGLTSSASLASSRHSLVVARSIISIARRLSVSCNSRAPLKCAKSQLAGSPADASATRVRGATSATSHNRIVIGPHASSIQVSTPTLRPLSRRRGWDEIPTTSVIGRGGAESQIVDRELFRLSLNRAALAPHIHLQDKIRRCSHRQSGSDPRRLPPSLSAVRQASSHASWARTRETSITALNCAT